MNRQQAVQLFKEEILPAVQAEYEQDGVPDIPARREEWNNWTDGLCKDGVITEEQYERWECPW